MSSITGHPEAPEIGSRWIARRDLGWEEDRGRYHTQEGTPVVVLRGCSLIDGRVLVRYIGEDSGKPQLVRLARWAERFVSRAEASPELLEAPQRRRDAYIDRIKAGMSHEEASAAGVNRPS